jgi:MFS family permease
LMRAYDIREDLAGLVMGVVTVIGLGGPILGGILADRWQRKRPSGRMRLAAVSIAIASVFLYLVLFAALDIGNKHLMMFCALMMPFHSVFVGMAFPAVAATTQDVAPAHLKGLTWGGAMLALYLLGAWGPALVGSISDAFGGGYKGLALGIAVTGLFGFVASAMWLMSERHIEKDKQRAIAADA